MISRLVWLCSESWKKKKSLPYLYDRKGAGVWLLLDLVVFGGFLLSKAMIALSSLQTKGLAAVHLLRIYV